MNRISIRWRMTLWNTAAFAVVLVAFGILVYSLLRQTHYEQIDRVLTARYREVAQTINSMIQRLERSFEEVRRFTADASHELRTPIAVIRSEAELGVDASHDPEGARQRFESILEECSRLASATSQLLTLSREDAGVVWAGRTLVPLAPTLLETVESIRPFANAKHQDISAEVNCDAEVLADPERLRQVFHNLLDNAIKYTPEKGRIRVTLGRENSHTVIAVEDNGTGIPPEHLSRVFDRFHRVNTSSDAGDGAGLGLSIVQSIVLSLGGRVEVKSTIGEGSTFRVFLPAPS